MATIALGLTCIAEVIERDPRFAWSSFAIACGSGIVLSFLLAWLLSLMYPTKLDSEGVHGYSFLGLRSFVLWTDIESVRGFRLLNLKYIKLYSKQTGRVTWLGLFPADQTAFWKAIKDFCPSENPLMKVHVA